MPGLTWSVNGKSRVDCVATMFRCVVAELFSLGGGHALSGALTRAFAWTAAVVVTVVLCLFTPLAVWLCVGVRLASIVEAGRRGRRGPAGGRWHWKPMLAFVVVSFGFLAVTRETALEAFKIPSAAMSPTLQIGDYVVGDKLSLKWKAPARGEVVVYEVDGVAFVGRVVGIGGDEVAVRSDVVYLNGAAVPQRPFGEVSYFQADESGETPTIEKASAVWEELGGHRYRVITGGGAQSNFPHEEGGCQLAGGPPDFGSVALQPGPDETSCRVPAGTVFIVRDFRSNSIDSRHRGAIPVTSVRARVVGVWMSKNGGMFSRVGATD
jgi:signal peptidase I